MSIRAMATLALAVLLAGGCNTFNPWPETLETPEVQALKADHEGPMAFKAVVGLRVDPLAFRRTTAEDIAALRDETAGLASEVRDAQAPLDAIAAQGLLSPEALNAKIQALLGEGKTLLQGFEQKSDDARKGAVDFIAKADALCAKLAEIRATVAAAAADEAKRAGLAEREAEAGAECQTLIDAGAPLAEALIAAAHPRAETFQRVLTGLGDAMNQIVLANGDLQEAKFDEAGAKLDTATAAIKAVCDEARPLAEGTEDAQPRLEAFASAVEALVSPGEALLPAIGESLKQAAASARLAIEALKAKDAEKTMASFKEGVGHLELAGSSAAAEAEKGAGGPLAAAAESPRRAAERLAAFFDRIGACMPEGASLEEETRQALLDVQKAVTDARTALEAAAEGKAADAKPLFAGALAAVDAARKGLAEEADRLSSDTDREASFQPEPADFLDVFVKNLEGFEMFHGVEALAGPARDAPVAEYLDAAAVADADFLVLVEPLRNNLRYMGFNSNWYYNFWIWAFAWLASNFVPDETWESRIDLQFSVVDVRSGEVLFRRQVSSAAALNLADTDDGWQLFGIVFGSCSRDCLEQAYPKVLPYHLNLIRKELLRDLAVEFKAYTGTEEFTASRSKARPAGFGVVVGVGRYASEKFAGGTAEAAPKVNELVAKAEKAAAILSQVAEALGERRKVEGASGLSEGVQALRKGTKLLEMAGPEFLANDYPTAARSLSEARAALVEARTRLQGILPKPEGLDAILRQTEELAREAEALDAEAAKYAPEAAVVEVGRKAGLLAPDAEGVPQMIRDAGAKLGEEGAGLEAIAQALSETAALLREAEAAFLKHSVPPAVQGVQNAQAAVAAAFDAVDPLKGKAAEAAAVSGKLGFLKSSLEGILTEAAALKAPDSFAKWSASCGAIAAKAQGLTSGMEDFEVKAAGRANEQDAVIQAVGPAAAGAAEASALLKEAAACLGERKGTEAAAKLQAAGEKAGSVASSLGPVVQNLPTLVGEALKWASAIEDMAGAQEEAAKGAEKAPGKEVTQGLTAQQDEVAKALAKAAETVDAQAAVLKEAGQASPSEDAAKCAAALKSAAATAGEAARAFGLLDSPEGLKKQKEALTAMEAARDLLKALAPQVPDIGKEAFAMDGLIGRQEGLCQEAKAVAETLAGPFDALAAAQEAVLVRAREAAEALRGLAKTFPGAEKELPEVLAAAGKAAEELDVVLKRGVEAAAMLKKGDALGGAREQKGILERLRAAASLLAGSGQGKRTHVDLIQEVVGDLKFVAAETARAAGALVEGASRYQVDRASADATAFAEYLGDPAGAAIGSTRLSLLVDEKATASAIRESFGELLKNRVLVNDLFVFYFAGCGGLLKVPFERKSEVMGLVPKFKNIADRLKRTADGAGNLRLSREAEEFKKGLEARGKAVGALADAAVKAITALEGEPADEAKAQAAEALKPFVEKFTDPAAACGEAAARLGALEAAGASEKALACVEALKVILTDLDAVPAAPGVAEFKAAVAGEIAALETLAGRIAGMAPPDSVTRLVADLTERVQILREDEAAVSKLATECAAFTPEPAAATAAAALGLSDAIARIEEAAELFGKCSLGPGREKLAAALAAVQGAQAVVEDMGVRMEDLFTHYLLPFDADPARPAETGISLFELGRLLAGLKAKHMVLVFDSSFAPGAPKRGCGVFSGPEPKNVDDGYARYVALQDGWTVIFAGGPGEGASQTAKGGALTAALIEGARGAADADGNGKVTNGELVQYLEQKVPAASAGSGAPHKPLIKCVGTFHNAFEPVAHEGGETEEGK